MFFLSCAQPNKKHAYSQNQTFTPRTNKNEGFFNMFKKEEKIITVKELWYRGLP